ncbi:sensor histidine kinase [Puia sp.]|uniref:sensor histidine kinase n=1 Tax=Puia sp. TaxID=2045100 RepID=UPI002F415487
MVIGQPSLSYTRLTVEDGLSNNSVQCILQDKNGILWIGTNGGLNRYDGSFLVQYSILSEPTLTNSVITALLQDQQGRIWIGTENGLNILDPRTNTIRRFVHDASPASLPQGPVRAIQKRKNGHVWVLSDRWLVDFTDEEHFLPVNIDSGLLQTNMVLTGLTEKDDHAVWVSYLDNRTTLAKRTVAAGREKIGAPLLFAPDYSKIYVDEKNAVWGVSCYGVSRFDEQAGRFTGWIKNCQLITGPNLHLHSCFCSDANGNIWQGNDRAGLVRYDLSRQQVTDYSWVLAAENASIVYCVYKDHNNTIWVGTDNGIIKISNREAVFTSIPFSLRGQPLKDIRCRAIMTDRKDNLYAATENYGLLKRMHTRSGTDTTVALSNFGAVPVSALPVVNRSIRLPLNGRYDIGYIYDMWYDQQDIIWLAGFGIGRYDTRTDSLEIFLAGGTEQEKQESINQFSICNDGKLFWTAGQYNVYTFDPQTRSMQPFRDDKGNMPFHHLSCWSLVAKDGWIWAGAANGLYKIDTHSHKVIKLSVDRRLEYGINDITPDGDSSFWISTAGGGVIRFNEKSGEVQQYTNKEGLSNNTVCGLLEDKNRDLWISTYAGLSYFNRATNQFTNFYAKDGLNTDEFNRKAFYRMRDGRMIFGGLNGYVVFDPDKAFRTKQPVTILLTRFNKTSNNGNTTDTVFNGQTPGQVVIGPGDRFFSFYFMLSDLYDPGGNRFFYQLQGVDDVWHSIGSQHFISFNSLSPGKYTLKIRGNTGNGSRSINELSIDIRVKPVFYKTIWFIALVIAAAIAIVWWGVRYRIRQVQKIQWLRTRIASDLHDDVGSSLVRITILADAIKREGITDNTQEQLGAISGISRGAVSTMKDVVWSIDARNDTMLGMIQYMQEHLYNMLAAANIDFELTHAGVAGQERLTMNFRQNVYLTFKEAINNVVKHSGASRVDVELRREKGLFVMRIKDDGKGIGKERAGNGQAHAGNGQGHTGSGQGLYNMRLRADRLRASLDIESGPGVTITLSVPV